MNTDQNTNDIRPISDAVTWAVLLSQWTRFAQSAVAFPQDSEGDRWKSSVTPMIGLQAVCFALRDAASLSVDERSLGLDRAGVLIREHSHALDATWRGEPMPDELLELLSDSVTSLEAARHLAFHATVVEDGFVMPDAHDVCERALSEGFTGDLYAARPGTILLAGAPAVVSLPWPVPFEIPGLTASETPEYQRQVYRSLSEEEHTVQDEVVPHHASMPSGRPLLEPVILDGKLVREAVDEPPVRAWIEQQARAMEGRGHAVVFTMPDDETEGE